MIFWLKGSPAMSAQLEGTLSEEEKGTLLRLARATLEKWLSSHQYLSPQELKAFSLTERLHQRAGVFVTLHEHGQLRGCIGYIEGENEIYQDVIENAVNAATRDPRFPPITSDELSAVNIEISLMTPLEETPNPDDIEVGKHGLVVEKGFCKGLLLPQVAPEWGWDRYEFLEQTCRKAGLPRDAWKKGAHVYRFSAQVFGEQSPASEKE
jgi:AmmeMemoRadiSam system protein A